MNEASRIADHAARLVEIGDIDAALVVAAAGLAFISNSLRRNLNVNNNITQAQAQLLYVRGQCLRIRAISHVPGGLATTHTDLLSATLSSTSSYNNNASQQLSTATTKAAVTTNSNAAAAATAARPALDAFTAALRLVPNSQVYAEAAADAAIACNSPKQALYFLSSVNSKNGFGTAPTATNSSNGRGGTSLRACILMAKAYKALNMPAKFKDCLWNIVRIEPLALDSLKSLINLGESLDAIVPYIPEIHRPWVVPLLAAHEASLECNFKDAKKIAHCHVKEGNNIMANYAFEQASPLIRKLDPQNTKYMDQYARVLQTQGTLFQLNRLATDMVAVSENHPETWLVMARYCETKGSLDRAMQLTEKALKLNSRHMESYLLKGALQLALHLPQEAISSFKIAHEMSPSLESYRGLMEAYVACKRTKEALSVAKESLKKMPENARAIVLVGCVLSNMPERRAQAQATFKKALSLDPKCTEALYALASSLVNESKYQAAADLLQSNLIHINNHIAHTRLGDIYAVLKNFDAAMEHYNIALKIDAGYGAAKIGFERVEKMIGRMEDMDDDGTGGGGGENGAADDLDAEGGRNF
ncbi:Anaphase-promoting complex subunit 7 [Physocladia obscura]|uniref:Anaphase-promoting complex subunit 7 n=1 Tax=Physocladia obscura TaxID=109957 RepID=A0AAD5T5B5_9FUNG|nr:Anaphase-promoting complex subunit 7 [Physocladia obscura]